MVRTIWFRQRHRCVFIDASTCECFWRIALCRRAWSAIVGQAHAGAACRNAVGRVSLRCRSRSRIDVRCLRRRLIRPRTGRKVAGVCAGFAEYFNLDVTLVRLVWIVAGIAMFPLWERIAARALGASSHGRE